MAGSSVKTSSSLEERPLPSLNLSSRPESFLSPLGDRALCGVPGSAGLSSALQ